MSWLKLFTSHIQIKPPLVSATDVAEDLMCGIIGGAVHLDHFPHQGFHMSSGKIRCRLHYMLDQYVLLCQLSAVAPCEGSGASAPAVGCLADHLHLRRL